jgi:cell division protein FtsB
VPQLEIYLNDHLAGATGGVELARRLRASNRDDAVFGETLSRVCAEIEADRTVLEQVIEGLGYSRSKVKPAAAWVAEKLGRLKLNGQLRGYSPLSRLIELEGLLIGITGKIGLWQTLAELGAGEDLDADLEQLTARAAAQRAAIDDLHRIAAAAVER